MECSISTHLIRGTYACYIFISYWSLYSDFSKILTCLSKFNDDFILRSSESDVSDTVMLWTRIFIRSL